jgi:hypothetical protein
MKEFIRTVPTVVTLRFETDTNLVINHVKINDLDTDFYKYIVVSVYTEDKVPDISGQNNVAVFRLKNFLNEVYPNGIINNNFNEPNFTQQHPIEVKIEISSEDNSFEFPDFEIEVDYSVI